MNFFRKLRKLSFLDLVRLLMAFYLLVFFKLAIKILSLPALKKFYTALVGEPTDTTFDKVKYDRRAWALMCVSARLPFLGLTCLPKALAFRFWYGTYANLKVHFGVQKNEINEFIAHAWVSHKGKAVFGEDPNYQYQTIWEWE
jgi:hypothetical protein